MHRLLDRQLKRFLGKSFDFEKLDNNFKELLNTISDVYTDFDNQRRMQEHIITVSSEELRSSNNQLKELLDERSKLLENKTIENKDIINLLHQYKEAIDQSLIVSRTDINGVITYANDKFCEISGYTREELIGRPHNIVRNPNNPKELYKNIWETISKKKIWTGTFSNLTKEKKEYYVNSTIIPLLDLNGNITEYIALRDDVTQQVLYQKKLKNQTQRLNTIFNSQENVTIIIKPDVGIIDANEKFFETFGFETLVDFKASNDCVCDIFNEKEMLKTSDGTKDLRCYDRFLISNSNINKVTITTKEC